MTAQHNSSNTKVTEISRTDLWFKTYDTCVTVKVRGTSYLRWYNSVKGMISRLGGPVNTVPRELRNMTESEVHALFNFMTRMTRVRKEHDTAALRTMTGMTNYKVYCNYDDPVYVRIIEAADDSGYVFSVERITETHPGVIRTKTMPAYKHRMYLKPHGSWGEDLSELRKNLREFLDRNKAQVHACSALESWLDWTPPNQWAYKPVLAYYFVEYNQESIATMLGFMFPEVFSPKQYTLEVQE